MGADLHENDAFPHLFQRVKRIGNLTNHHYRDEDKAAVQGTHVGAGLRTKSMPRLNRIRRQRN